MSKRGRRSQESITRRKIQHSLKTKLLQDSWRDGIRAETICLTNRDDLYSYGINIFGETFTRIELTLKEPFFEACDRGTVLSDCYGRGAFQ